MVSKYVHTHRLRKILSVRKLLLLTFLRKTCIYQYSVTYSNDRTYVLIERSHQKGTWLCGCKHLHEKLLLITVNGCDCIVIQVCFAFSLRTNTARIKCNFIDIGSQYIINVFFFISFVQFCVKFYLLFQVRVRLLSGIGVWIRVGIGLSFRITIMEIISVDLL